MIQTWFKRYSNMFQTWFKLNFLAVSVWNKFQACLCTTIYQCCLQQINVDIGGSKKQWKLRLCFLENLHWRNELFILSNFRLWCIRIEKITVKFWCWWIMDALFLYCSGFFRGFFARVLPSFRFSPQDITQSMEHNKEQQKRIRLRFIPLPGINCDLLSSHRLIYRHGGNNLIQERKIGLSTDDCRSSFRNNVPLKTSSVSFLKTIQFYDSSKQTNTQEYLITVLKRLNQKESFHSHVEHSHWY